MPLSGSQRRFLRALANRERAALLVAGEAPGDGAVAEVDRALRARELVKVRLARPADRHAFAAALAERCGAELVDVVGHVVVLFRADVDAPRIALPPR